VSSSFLQAFHFGFKICSIVYTGQRIMHAEKFQFFLYSFLLGNVSYAFEKTLFSLEVNHCCIDQTPDFFSVLCL